MGLQGNGSISTVLIPHSPDLVCCYYICLRVCYVLCCVICWNRLSSVLRCPRPMVFRGYIAITHILLLLAILSAPNFFAAIIRGNSIPNEETVKRSKLNVRPQQTDASRPGSHNGVWGSILLCVLRVQVLWKIVISIALQKSTFGLLVANFFFFSLDRLNRSANQLFCSLQQSTTSTTTTLIYRALFSAEGLWICCTRYGLYGFKYIYFAFL